MKRSKVDANTVQALRRYVLEKGFQYDGIWYFRTSWMDRSSRQILENTGLIKKVGTCVELHSSGVRLPGDFVYNKDRKDGALIYKVNDSKINKLIQSN